jgi:hypothetical protein
MDHPIAIMMSSAAEVYVKKGVLSTNAPRRKKIRLVTVHRRKLKMK